MFRGQSFERQLDVPDTPYTMIKGDDFFGGLLTQLESSGVSFHWSCENVAVDGQTVRVDGAVREFDCVIDAAFQPSAASSVLWQSFAGVWVRTRSATFDPTTAIVMDIHESSPTAPVSFLYVLPTSTTTALIEHTTFSPTPLPKQDHLEQCSRWIHRKIAADVEKLEYEHGIIPMGLSAVPAQGVYATGSNAGTIRPATGYAFLSTLRYSRQLSERVIGRQAAPATIHPHWLTLGDKIFLRALLNSPLSGGKLMEKLLSRAPAKALIAFLSGDVTFSQACSVWSSVPKIEMLRALLRI